MTPRTVAECPFCCRRLIFLFYNKSGIMTKLDKLSYCVNCSKVYSLSYNEVKITNLGGSQ